MSFNAIETAQERLKMAEYFAKEFSGETINLSVSTVGDYTVVDDGQDRWIQDSADFDSACEDFLQLVLKGKYDDVDYFDTDWYSEFCNSCGCLYSRIGAPNDLEYFCEKVYENNPDDFEEVMEKMSLEDEDLPAMAIMISNAGDRCSGNDALDEAQSWLDEDFDTQDASLWVESGFWNASAAAACRDYGMDAQDAVGAAQELRDLEGEDDSAYTDECPIYSVCNGDTNVQVIIDKHNETH